MSLVLKILDKFGRNLNTAVDRNLKKHNKGDSILNRTKKFEAVTTKTGFEFVYFIQDYWEFVDRGVVGTGVKVDGTPVRKRRTTDKKFKFKKGIRNKPSRKHFDQWTIRKGIAGRTKGGQFLSRIGLTTAISYNVWYKGLPTTHFLTTPLNRLLKTIPNKLIEAYSLDVDIILQKQLNGK